MKSSSRTYASVGNAASSYTDNMIKLFPKNF
jgi:hypothetical protein